jgi:hypothetical protein
VSTGHHHHPTSSPTAAPAPTSMTGSQPACSQEVPWPFSSRSGTGMTPISKRSGSAPDLGSSGVGSFAARERVPPPFRPPPTSQGGFWHHLLLKNLFWLEASVPGRGRLSCIRYGPSVCRWWIARCASWTEPELPTGGCMYNFHGVPRSFVL